MNTVSRKTPGKRLLPGVLALALLAAMSAQAQDPAATPAPAAAPEPAAAPAAAGEQEVLRFDQAITPDARDAMDRMTSALNALQRFSLTAQVSRDETLSFGYKLQHNESVTMLVQRPNRMKVDVTGDIKNRAYYYDGSRLTVLSKDLGVYAKTPAPGTIGELVGQMLDQGIDMPLMDMLYNGVAGDLLDDVRVGKVIGDAWVDGEQTTHLAFRQPDVDWQLWVSQSTGLPRKILITTRYEVGDPQYQAVMRWNSDARIAAKDFDFVPASGVREIKAVKTLASSGGAK